MSEERDAAYRNAGLGELLSRARFEVVPIRGAEDQVRFLPPGATVTVTCSPRRGIERTLELCELLAGKGFHLVPHISARLVRDGSHLAEVLDRVRDAGIDELFVVAGDVPGPVGPYTSSLDLLTAMAEIRRPLPGIGVAGYPERHPFVPESDLAEALRRKQPFATYVVSQICFDPATVLSWIGSVRRSGIDLPVMIGLPAPLKRRKLLEISLRVGVGDSIRYVVRHGSLVARIARRGGYRPDAFVATLSTLLGRDEVGPAGFHINTFNQVESAERWRRHTMEAYGWSPPGPTGRPT